MTRYNKINNKFDLTSMVRKKKIKIKLNFFSKVIYLFINQRLRVPLTQDQWPTLHSP